MKHLIFVMAGDLRQEYEVCTPSFVDVTDPEQYVFNAIKKSGWPGGWFEVKGQERTVSIAHVAEVYLKEDA